jgi:hypothetical protein
MKDLKVKVTEYRGFLVFETLRPEEGQTSDFFPAGGSSFGCILGDCAKLGVSQEALDILKNKINRGSDDLGDPDIFSSGDKVVFGWIGGPYAIKLPETCEGSNSYNASLLDGVCHIVENETSEGAMEAIDSALDEKSEEE